MTDSFPFPPYEITTAETGLTEGDTEYAGGMKYVWRQPDPKNDAGYWEPIKLENEPTRSDENYDLILERLTAIEKVLKINKK